MNKPLTDIEPRRVTAIDILARKGGEPIVALTSYHAHTARIIDPLRRLHAGRRFARHGHARLRDDAAGHPRHDDPAGPGGDARLAAGRWSSSTCPSAATRRAARHAFRTAARVMKETGCGAIKLEGGRRMAETIRFPRRARHSGHGPCRPDAAVVQHHGRLSGPGPRCRRQPRPSAKTPRPWPMPAPLRSCSRRWSSRSPARSPRLVQIPTDRHRRLAGLRRPDPGARGHARSQPAACRNSSSATAVSPAIEASVRAYAEEVAARGRSRPMTTSTSPRPERRKGEIERLQARGRGYMVRRRGDGRGPTTVPVRKNVRYLSRSRRGPSPRTVQEALGPLRHLCHRPRGSDRRCSPPAIVAGSTGRIARRPQAATASSRRSGSPTDGKHDEAVAALAAIARTAAAAIRSSPPSASPARSSPPATTRAPSPTSTPSPGRGTPAPDPGSGAAPRGADPGRDRAASPIFRHGSATLADTGNPWRHSAREILGLAAWRSQRLHRRRANISRRSPTTRKCRRTSGRGRSSCWR